MVRGQKLKVLALERVVHMQIIHKLLQMIYMLIGVVTVHLLQEMEEILDLQLSMVFLVLVVKLVTVGTEELL